MGLACLVCLLALYPALPPLSTQGHPAWHPVPLQGSRQEPCQLVPPAEHPLSCHEHKPFLCPGWPGPQTMRLLSHQAHHHLVPPHCAIPSLPAGWVRARRLTGERMKETTPGQRPIPRPEPHSCPFGEHQASGTPSALSLTSLYHSPSLRASSAGQLLRRGGTRTTGICDWVTPCQATLARSL